MRIGQRFKQNWVDSAEDGCARTDAERQRQYTDSRESYVVAQLTRRITDICGKGSDNIFPSVRMNLLLYQRHVSRLKTSGTTRVFNRKPSIHSRCNGLIKVLLHFIGDILICSIPIYKTTQTVHK